MYCSVSQSLYHLIALHTLPISLPPVSRLTNGGGGVAESLVDDLHRSALSHSLSPPPLSLLRYIVLHPSLDPLPVPFSGFMSLFPGVTFLRGRDGDSCRGCDADASGHWNEICVKINVSAPIFVVPWPSAINQLNTYHGYYL